MNALTRDTFRDAVFTRDKYRCVCCKAEGVDAHHIMERRLFPDGGYYLDNGVTLCAYHHILAEQTIISCDELREFAGIRKIVLPDHLDDSVRYDKWGNPYLNKDTRVHGELFYEENVQRILGEGKVLNHFIPWSKYPKTMHLPWSPGLQNDDRMLQTFDGLIGEEVIIGLKLDGENTAMYTRDIHARSMDGKNHPSRDWVKALHGRIKHEIPEDWRINGENCYAKHSLYYPNLPTYFFVFNIWERGRRLAWDEITAYCEILGLATVPVLWRGIWNEDKVRELTFSLDPEKNEGVVVQVTRSLAASEWKKCAAKYVRAKHVQTTQLWMLEKVIPNGLADNPGSVSFEGQ